MRVEWSLLLFLREKAVDSRRTVVALSNKSLDFLSIPYNTHGIRNVCQLFTTYSLLTASLQFLESVLS